MRSERSGRSLRSRTLRGVLAIAATYLLFLLCAQFGFLEQARRELPPAAVQRVMAAMGLAGLAASLATGRLLAAAGDRPLVRGALLAAAVAAALSLLAHGPLALTVAGAALGATLGVLTVAVAAGLPALLPGPRRGLATGAGTGIAYLAANLPPLFAGTPAVRALVPAGLAVLAAALLPAPSGIASTPPETGGRGARPRFPALVVAFAALVALDACAFAVIQAQPALAAPTWGSDARRLLQGSTHLVTALAAGLALDAGALAGLLAGSWALFAVAFGLLLGGGPLLGLAGPLYAAGISAYSTALVIAPSGAPDRRLPARWQAALLYGLAGWLGSAAGVGAAQDLGTIPRSLVGVAGFAMLGLAWGRPGARRRLVRAAAPALALALVALAAGRVASSSPRADPPVPAATGGEPAGEPAGGPMPDATRGRAVYVAEGCIHCHSQYVRPAPTRDAVWWGPERPLDRAATPVLIGNRRQGPDLAEVGNRRDALWNREHLRDPRRFDPASRMPAYPHLFAPGERRGEDLVAYLASLGEGTLRERDALTAGEPSPPAAGASPERGRALFATWCAGCHGADARGHGALEAARPASLLDLTRPRFRLVPEGPGAPPLEESLARVVRHGLPPTSMPGHEYLTEREVADLVAHLAAMHRGAAR